MKDKDIQHEGDYWNHFYKDWTIDIPSQFCVLAATEISADNTIVEFGCGNGRDSLYFAEHSFNVIAMDLSQEAIKKDKLTASAKKGRSLTFLQGDVSNQEDVTRTIDYARGTSDPQNVTIYTRFFLHTLDDEQETTFIDILTQKLQKDDQIYFEFRSLEDKNKEKIYEDHYRRYVNTQLLIKTLNDKLNIKKLYTITGQGMAKYKQEDPYVSRIIIDL